MKNISKHILLALLSLLTFTACEEEPSRTFFPHSTPVIESAAINPSSFTYGDSVSITASVSDPTTPLSTMEMKVVINDMIVTTQTFRTKDKNAQVSSKILIPFISELPDNANVEVLLKLTNVEGDVTNGTIEGVKGKRKYFDKLYAVLEDGTVIPLISKGQKSDLYESDDIRIKGGNIRYKVVEKVTLNNEIDFSGYVWGADNGNIKLVGEKGEYISTTNATLRYIDKIVFDTYLFKTTLTGTEIDPNNLILDLEDFTDITLNGVAFKKITLPIKEDQSILLEGVMANEDIVYHLDFFSRTETNRISFTGNAGTWDLYYSPTHKYVLADPTTDRSYPNYLLVCGEGLGYPSKVLSQAVTGWGFDNLLTNILFRKISDGVYQANVYFDATMINFKPFETSGWGNEKISSLFTMPPIIARDIDLNKTDGNWYATADATSGNYKITINLTTSTVTAEAITLP